MLADYHVDEMGETAMHLLDLNSNAAYGFKIGESLEKGETVLEHLVDFEVGQANYAYPYRDSMHFVLSLNFTDYNGTVVGKSGEMIKQNSIYDVPGFQNYEKLLSANSIRPNSDRIAMAMIYFPQVNFFDIETGERKTVAVDKSCKHWKQDLGRDSREMLSYYGCSTASA